MGEPKFTFKIKTNPNDLEYQDGHRWWQGIPGIAKAVNGRLWACWYSGGISEGPGNWIMLYTSADDGESWKGPVFVIDSEDERRATDPNLWMDPDGRMWLFFHLSHSEGPCDFTVWAIHTDNPGDEVPTWSEPKRVANGVAINDAIVLKDGTWVLPTTVWTMHVTDALGDENNAGCYISNDKGETWIYQGSIDGFEGPRKHEETIIVEKEDGHLQMYIRTGAGINTSHSYDKGKTWSYGVDANYTKTDARHHFKRLASGNILSVYNNPPTNDGSRTYMTAKLSTDDGETWPYELLLDRRLEVSYPDTQQDADGNIYIIYDCQRWSAMEILMAKITEADIMAGKLVTETSFLQKLVNNNGGVEPRQPDYDHAKGAQVELKEMATFEWTNGTLEAIAPGKKLFTNGQDVFGEMIPEALQDKKYLYAGNDNSANTLKITSDGYLYVFTYTDAYTPIQKLRDRGFRTQVTMPQKQICKTFPWPIAFMEKEVKAGEEINLCEWAVVIAK